MQTDTRKISQATYRTLFWLFLTFVSVFRLFLVDKFGLGVDESHYLLYSRHLAWGYFDHPPMVAFLAALTALLGDSVFFVRLGPVLCSLISLILLRYLALALYPASAGPGWPGLPGLDFLIAVRIDYRLRLMKWFLEVGSWFSSRSDLTYVRHRGYKFGRWRTDVQPVYFLDGSSATVGDAFAAGTIQ